MEYEAISIFSCFSLKGTEKQDKVIKYFDGWFLPNVMLPKRGTFLIALIIFLMVQRENDTVEDCVAKLKNWSQSCEFDKLYQIQVNRTRTYDVIQDKLLLKP